MRVLIIGASGFIGHYLQRRLLQKSDFEVTSTYNSRVPQDIDQSWDPLEITDHQTFGPDLPGGQARGSGVIGRHRGC